ncbi:MAG: hypothetical protein QXM22_02505 [Candidatus Bathyarchaeia archaeon]
MPENLGMEKIGEYAFLAFVIIAVVAGIAYGYNESVTSFVSPDRWDPGWIYLLMVIFGVIIGLVSITEKEATPFLIAAIALIVANSNVPFTYINNIADPLGYMITWIVRLIATFAAPAAIILAVKAIFALARTK